MTQIFGDKGIVIPVTVVEAGPCVVTQIKTKEKDGYDAVQIGFEDAKKNATNKPSAGLFKKAGVTPKKVLREFRIDDNGTAEAPTYKLGDVIACDLFAVNDIVDVTSKTKGHGFSGTIKRWNFHRQRMTHGNSRSHRVPGSVGSNSDPSRVFPGKKLPGQYGHEQVTIQNLTIAGVDKAKNCLLIKGGIPGPDGSLVGIRTAVKGGKK